MPVKLKARGEKHSARAGRITEMENGAMPLGSRPATHRLKKKLAGPLGSRPATHELRQKLVEQKPENR